MIDLNTLKRMNYNIVLTYKCNLNCQHCYNTKTNESMPIDLLHKANEFICRHINSHTIEVFEVQYIGGEIGIYDQELIKSSIEYIKENTKGKTVTFLYQTNLAYDLTNSHKEVLNVVDTIGTSYDYTVRLNDIEKRVLWFMNLKYLNSIGKNIELVITKTRPLIKNITPTMLLDFLIGMDIHRVVLNSCMITNRYVS